MSYGQVRSKRGAAIIGLAIAVFFFILFCGLFTFDACRAQMAERELTAMCDSAALAGTSMLATYDISNDTPDYSVLYNAQQNAQNYAINMVRMGSVLGVPTGLTNTLIVSSQASLFNPPPTTGETKIFVQWCDPSKNYAPVDLSVPANRPLGRAVQVQCCYGYRPAFFTYVGLGTYPLNAQSVGGLPLIDSVMVFDFSGSMDDNTYVTFVYRVWDNIQNKMDYRITTNPGTDYTLSNYTKWNFNASPNGSGTNVLPPQSLYALGFSGTNANDPKPGYSPNVGWSAPNCTQDLIYESRVRTIWGKTAVAAENDYGSPPGNCYAKYGNNAQVPYNIAFWGTPAVNPADWNAPDPKTNPRKMPFTDLVVNIDQPNAPPYVQPLAPRAAFQTGPFGGPGGGNSAPALQVTLSGGKYSVPDITGGGQIDIPYETEPLITGKQYSFDNIGVLVEAARGNMENDTVFGQAFNMASYSGTTPPCIQVNGTAAIAGVTTGNLGWKFPARMKGYQLMYERLAMLYSQPIATAVDGAYTAFYQKINVLANCRYGFVGFSGATPPYSVSTALSGGESEQFENGSACYYISTPDPAPPPVQPNGGVYWLGQAWPTTLPSTGFRIPRSPLDGSSTATQTSTWLATTGATTPWDDTSDYASGSGSLPHGLMNGTPLIETDVGEAMTAAYKSWHSGTYDLTGGGPRPGSRHAVVLFTDGVPSDQTPGAPTGASLTMAQNLNADGASLFVIALDVNATVNPSLQSDQLQFLGEKPNPGMCGIVSNGSKFFPVTSSADVKTAFSAIVRRLTQNQR